MGMTVVEHCKGLVVPCVAFVLSNPCDWILLCGGFHLVKYRPPFHDTITLCKNAGTWYGVLGRNKSGRVVAMFPKGPQGCPGFSHDEQNVCTGFAHCNDHASSFSDYRQV